MSSEVDHFANLNIRVYKSMQNIVFLVEVSEKCSGAPCDQHITAENILDNFCRADFGNTNNIFNSNIKNNYYTNNTNIKKNRH